MSQTAWQISTPKRPNTRGKIRIKGMKNSPFLADAVMDALRPIPDDWSIILDIKMVPKIGMTDIWHRSAKRPVSITVGSFRKIAMICGAKMKQTAPTAVRKIVEGHQTQ